MQPKRLVLTVFICISLFITSHAWADFATEVIDLVNRERQDAGLRPLAYSDELSLAAGLHAQEMADLDYFSHTSQDGREFDDRIRDAGYDCAFCGENIAAGYSTPDTVVAGWMNSPGHRANILDPDFCDIGVGYAAEAGSTYTHYWTQDFGRRAGVTQCPAIAAAPPGAGDTFSEESDGGGGGTCFITSACKAGGSSPHRLGAGLFRAPAFLIIPGLGVLAFSLAAGRKRKS